MAELVFILVSPARGENIGAAARAMKTMGFSRLRIVGSDAHTPDRVGANFKEAVALAKEIGYTHYNTYKQRTATPVPLA